MFPPTRHHDLERESVTVSGEKTVHTLVSHVVDFVKDNPCNFSNDFTSPVQHAPQNFRGHLCMQGLRQERATHHKTRGGRIDANVSSHESNIPKICRKLAVLLIRESLDGTSVYDTLSISQGGCNCIFSDDSLSGTGVGSDEHRLVPLDGTDGSFLKLIQLERIRSRGRRRTLVFGYRDIGKIWGNGDLVFHLRGWYKEDGQNMYIMRDF